MGRSWVIVFLFVACFYIATQFATSRIIGNDGHFHIRYSQLLPQRGIPDKLPELRFTTWGKDYRDYHLLFHLLLVPFTFFSNISFGAKLAAALFASLAAMVFYWALLRFKVKMPILWLLLFMAGSAGFLFRIQMPRVQSLSGALLVLAITAFSMRDKRLIFVTAVLNVWLHDSFLLLPVIGVLWCLSNRIVHKKFDLSSLLILFCGLTVGMIVNPTFPKNIISYGFNIWRNIVPVETIPTAVEWLPFTAWHMAGEAAPILLTAAAIFLAIIYALNSKIVLGGDDNEERVQRIFIAFVMIFGLFLYFRSRRFLEYSVPLTILFLAIMHRDLLKGYSVKFQRFFLPALLSVVVLGEIFYVSAFIKTNQPDKEYNCYLEAGKWLARNVQKHETIFTADWDDFPPLYMQAPDLYYVAGLDPLYMKEYDNELYNLYGDITNGRREGPYASLIVDVFRSRYVFANDREGDFIRKIDSEKGAYRVFQKDECRIYYLSF